MSTRLRNLFFLLGIACIVVMVVSFDLSLTSITDNLARAGRWFFIACALWAAVYTLNAIGWYAIIHDGSTAQRIPFWRVLKYTVTGFALNTVTPVGLMGGEPYRIMELKPYVGIERATSSTLLYVMMHIFSHFWYWLLSVGIYIFAYHESLTPEMGMLLLATTIICSTGIYLFARGYRSGFTRSALRLLTHVPYIKKWATRFSNDKQDTLQRIDQQIAQLHSTRQRTFGLALSCELLARILSSVELVIFLQIFGINASLADGILMLGFTSLFANAMFFLPMQLGAREGGFAMAAGGLAIGTGIGVSVGLLIRLRELVCTIVGIGIMKIGNNFR